MRFERADWCPKGGVGPPGQRAVVSEIEAGPGFGHRIEIEHAALLAKPHEIIGTDIDGEVEEEAGSRRQEWAENSPIGLIGQPKSQMPDAMIAEEPGLQTIWLNDRAKLVVKADMTLKERQQSPGDGATANDHQWPIERGVPRGHPAALSAHWARLCRECVKGQ